MAEIYSWSNPMKGYTIDTTDLNGSTYYPIALLTSYNSDIGTASPATSQPVKFELTSRTTGESLEATTGNFGNTFARQIGRVAGGSSNAFSYIGKLCYGKSGGKAYWCIYVKGGQIYDINTNAVPQIKTGGWTPVSGITFGTGTNAAGTLTGASVTAWSDIKTFDIDDGSITAAKIANGAALKDLGTLSGVTNYDSYQTAGYYKLNSCSSKVFNDDSTGTFWGSMLVLDTADYTQQIVIANYTVEGYRMAVRTKVDSQNWTAWDRFYDTGKIKTYPTWSTFVNSSKTSTSAGVVALTSLRGNKYTATIDNGGTMFRIDSGAGDVEIFRQTLRAKYNVTTTGSFGVGNLKASSTIYSYFVGDNSGSFVNTHVGYPASDSGRAYGELITTSGAKMSISVVMTGCRIHDNVWQLHGFAQVEGYQGSFKFNTEVTAYDNSSIPVVYQRSMNEANTDVVTNVIEILEI